MTGAQAAERSGFSAPVIYAWETGRLNPRPFSLEVLAETYGVSVREIRSWEPPVLYRRVGPLVAEGDALPRQAEYVVGAPQMSAWEECGA